MATSNRNTTAEHREFELQSVKEFMIAHGGRVKNHQLVNYFRRFLNDPTFKAVNREKFKDFVNELSTIKVEQGEKILVLKRKYRPEGDSIDVSSYRPASDISISSSSSDVRAQSEPPTQPPPGIPATRDEADGGGMSKGRSESSLDRPCPPPVKSMDSISVNSLAMSTTSVASSESQASADSGQSSQTSVEEEDANQSVFSVKERAKLLNRMESDSSLLNVPSPGRRKELKSVRGSHDDDESHSSGASYVTLELDEREWMLTCCHSEYQEMCKLLNKNASLAKLKDFTNVSMFWH
ncbi:ankyrin repeat domain-containing protein SOWAHA-like [Gigantopelta aegis]|uniref:ankyrin repeat domain-containing protein SOWAHA-like n=1 Tax=Gigantopelta aegis TaxID=1735272 RepID=UPI001B88AF5E|nr:ankyrin repeat domain-containing protein SOWAHA-like [Gigantopelta aegis]